MPVGLGGIGLVVVNNYSLRVHILAISCFLSAVGLLLALTFLAQGKGARRRLIGIIVSVGFVFAVLIIGLLFALGRERPGGKVILHVRKGEPLPERVEVIRDVPEILRSFSEPINLEPKKNSDGSSTYSAQVRMGEWRVVPSPGYQTQMITLTPDKPKFEDDIIFVKILDGRPDDTPSQEEASRPQLEKKDPPSQQDEPRTELVNGPAVTEQDRAQTSTRKPETTDKPVDRPTSQPVKAKIPLKPITESPSPPTEVNDAFQEASGDVQMEAEYEVAVRNSSARERRGDRAGAIRVLSELMERYPNTSVAEKAKRKIAEIQKKAGEEYE